MSTKIEEAQRAKNIANAAVSAAKSKIARLEANGANAATLAAATKDKTKAIFEAQAAQYALANAAAAGAAEAAATEVETGSVTNAASGSPPSSSSVASETVVETGSVANNVIGRPRSNATVVRANTPPPAAGSPLILSAAAGETGAAGPNASVPLGNGSVPLGKQEASVNAAGKTEAVTNAATKTATVKKYVSGQTFTPKPNLSEYKITPITSSSSSTFNPNHRTVECIKITGTEPINITNTCYISTVQKAQQGGKTSKSKKSKKRVTHKKK